jgi:hypothetical protein
MKMKRTLLAIAVVALLATWVRADIEDPYYFSTGNNRAVKVDGVDTPEIRWPYTIVYDELTVCNIPIKMKVGMYVQVKDCKNKKIILEQVNCADIGKTGADDYPCYLGCVTFDVRANFDVKLGSKLNKTGDVIVNWSAYYDGGDTVTGDGDYHTVKLCVKAWGTAIYKAAPGDEVAVGSVDVTVKPQ